MSSKALHNIIHIKSNQFPLSNSNILHFQYIRKINLQKKQQQKLFSNNLLKSTISSLNHNSSLIKRKLENVYSSKSRKNIKTKVYNQVQKQLNPYKKAINDYKKVQSFIMENLQKSLHIIKEPIFQSKNEFKIRNMDFSLVRSKAQSEMFKNKSQLEQQKCKYQKMILKNPEQFKTKRRVKSASSINIKNVSRRISSSQLSDYLKAKPTFQLKTPS